MWRTNELQFILHRVAVSDQWSEDVCMDLLTTSPCCCWTDRRPREEQKLRWTCVDRDYWCVASTKDKDLAENIFQKYVPSMKTSPFDSKFNSASSGDIFIHEASLNYTFIFSYVREKNLAEILPKLVPWIKVSPFNAELNFESNGLVFMDGTSFWKMFSAKSLFAVLPSHQWNLFG